MNTPPEYRERAAQARRLARSTSDPTVREQLKILAGDYEKMADEAEHELVGERH